LILRALLCGHAGLFEAALADLAGLPLPRVIGLVRERRGAGFAALYRKAGLPIALLPAFRAVLAGIEDYGATVASADGAGLSQLLIERVLTACSHEGAETDKLYALLRRFEAEAAREVARAKAQDMMAQDMMVKDMLVMDLMAKDLMAKDLPLVPTSASAPSFASPAEPEKTWASDPSFEPALSSLDFPPVADLPDAAPAWRSEREEAICINVAALPVTFRGEAWLDRAPAAAQDISLWIEPDAAARDEPQPEGSWVNDERSVLAMLDQDFLPRPEAAFVPSSKPVGDCGVASCRGRIDIDPAAFVIEPDAASPQALALIESIRVELGLAGPNEPGHDAELDIFFEELQAFTGSGSRPDSAAFAVAA
jgi:hypothetical protein